jgi:hypothetical protein
LRFVLKRGRTSTSGVWSVTSIPGVRRTHGRRAADEAKPAGRRRACATLASTAGASDTGVPAGMAVARQESTPMHPAKSEFIL